MRRERQGESHEERETRGVTGGERDKERDMRRERQGESQEERETRRET